MCTTCDFISQLPPFTYCCVSVPEPCQHTEKLFVSQNIRRIEPTETWCSAIKQIRVERTPKETLIRTNDRVTVLATYAHTHTRHTQHILMNVKTNVPRNEQKYYKYSNQDTQPPKDIRDLLHVYAKNAHGNMKLYFKFLHWIYRTSNRKSISSIQLNFPPDAKMGCNAYGNNSIQHAAIVNVRQFHSDRISDEITIAIVYEKIFHT